ETKMPGYRIKPFFFPGQQVEEQGPDAAPLNDARDKLVAGTVPAAAAAMGEQHNCRGGGRQEQLTLELNPAGRYLDSLRVGSTGLRSRFAHSLPPTAGYVGVWLLRQAVTEARRRSSSSECILLRVWPPQSVAWRIPDSWVA